MAIWKDLTKTEPAVDQADTPKGNSIQPEVQPPPRVAPHHPEFKESIIGPNLTIEGKIEGQGDVRIAGNFKGDIRVKGNLIIEPGARISAEISAETITVGGEVEGNITAATQVKLLESGQLVGDLKATCLTVAAGSRMRGNVEFGWEGKELKVGQSKRLLDEAEKRSLT